MDYFQFNAKRVHLNMVAFARRVFWPVTDAKGNVVKEGVPEMTPARFDLLFAVHGPTRRHTLRCGIAQAALRRALALSRPTVSKMLKRLEELGLVWREPRASDRRSKWVHLTEEGRERIRAAMAIAFGKKPVAKKLQALYAPGFWKPGNTRKAVSLPAPPSSAPPSSPLAVSCLPVLVVLPVSVGLPDSSGLPLAVSLSRARVPGSASPPTATAWRPALADGSATKACVTPTTSCSAVMRAWWAPTRMWRAPQTKRRRVCVALPALTACAAPRTMACGSSTTTCGTRTRRIGMKRTILGARTLRRRRRRLRAVRWSVFDLFLEMLSIAGHFGPEGTLHYENPFPIYD